MTTPIRLREIARKLRSDEVLALKAPDVEPDIWTAQELMPQALRNECMAYLYRLEPAVFNAAGKGSNIGKYTIPVTQEDISKKHGGGKYKLWIKRGSRTLFQEIFILGGEPILSPDQKMVAELSSAELLKCGHCNFLTAYTT